MYSVVAAYIFTYKYSSTYKFLPSTLFKVGTFWLCPQYFSCTRDISFDLEVFRQWDVGHTSDRPLCGHMEWIPPVYPLPNKTYTISDGDSPPPSHESFSGTPLQDSAPAPSPFAAAALNVVSPVEGLVGVTVWSPPSLVSSAVGTLSFSFLCLQLFAQGILNNYRILRLSKCNKIQIKININVTVYYNII